MPYDGEFAGYGPLRRLANSERVKELLLQYRVRQHDEGQDGPAIGEWIEVLPTSWTPDKVLAIDGSNVEVEQANGFPGAEASYMTVASVILDLVKIRKLDEQRPVSPQSFRDTKYAGSIDCALPGCNVVFDGEESTRSSLRKTVYDVLDQQTLMDDGETLRETYEALLKLKPPSAKKPRCPIEDCPNPDVGLSEATGCSTCTCPLSKTLYSTDALRFHEGVLERGKNGAMYAEVRNVLETLCLVNILRSLERKQWLSSLRRVAVVMDGPLAVFGHPAWLSQAVAKELARLNGEVRKATGGTDMLILGIEKTGMFSEHLRLLDQRASGEVDRLEHGRVLLLDDAYIKGNIKFSLSEKPYGQDTYYGRKFLYKTHSGALLVGLVPFYTDAQRDPSTAEPDQYPRLADALALLDEMVSARYPNALVPLIEAHAEAAIPLNLGKKILEQLASELMRPSPG